MLKNQKNFKNLELKKIKNENTFLILIQENNIQKYLLKNFKYKKIKNTFFNKNFKLSFKIKNNILILYTKNIKNFMIIEKIFKKNLNFLFLGSNKTFFTKNKALKIKNLNFLNLKLFFFKFLNLLIFIKIKLYFLLKTKKNII